MVGIPPITMVMTGGWCKWHCYTNITRSSFRPWEDADSSRSATPAPMRLRRKDFKVGFFCFMEFGMPSHSKLSKKNSIFLIGNSKGLPYFIGYIRIFCWYVDGCCDFRDTNGRVWLGTNLVGRASQFNVRKGETESDWLYLVFDSDWPKAEISRTTVWGFLSSTVAVQDIFSDIDGQGKSNFTLKAFAAGSGSSNNTSWCAATYSGRPTIAHQGRWLQFYAIVPRETRGNSMTVNV